MLELDEIMRQKEDCEFAQFLCRVRTATTTPQDIDIILLRSRVVSDQDPNYPSDVLHDSTRMLMSKTL